MRWPTLTFCRGAMRVARGDVPYAIVSVQFVGFVGTNTVGGAVMDEARGALDAR